MKVVIDTNIWISYLLGGLLKDLDEKLLSKEIKVVVSNEMLKELAEVSNRPKMKRIIFFSKWQWKERQTILLQETQTSWL
ncbi:putative toxin-antitoxin system toxin component, PIN family [Candidatus Desantisbacteria bacterium CG1_02_38_46]|uniref:Putative toxin-antitoxin system toxin component, PIN family n=1 Tax=Candidatus Desantisbacteria bacterium CG1_02_38_46 TaxID=1817893 RepID=A0A1J4SFT2_9BACT|nr:MAG: putative toxin-antitoxin system toxin component, PIN family [Candidatus Desantisbacteria bacterium CG1_02_38_46]